MPWLEPGRGPAHVGKFLRTAGEQLDFKYFKVNHVLEGKGVVVALCSLEATVKATGKKMVETDEPHVWYFNEQGKVNKFRHAPDTYQQFQALQPEKTTAHR